MRKPLSFRNVALHEVPPGYVKARVMEDGGGELGVFWVDPDDVALERAAYRHPPFEGEMKERIEKLYQTFRGTSYGESYQKWEDGFRRDMHPENEIAIWEYWGQVFRHFTEGRQKTQEQLDDILGVIMEASSSMERVRKFYRPRTLSARWVNAICDYMLEVAGKEVADQPEELPEDNAYTTLLKRLLGGTHMTNTMRLLNNPENN